MRLLDYRLALHALEKILALKVSTIPYEASLDAPNTYKGIIDHYNKTGKLLVYSGASETTIYSKPIYNVYFRAIHDLGHILHGLSFKYDDERKLGAIQALELSQCALDLGYSSKLAANLKAIVEAETIGKIDYYAKHSKFIDNQQAFILDYLKVS